MARRTLAASQKQVRLLPTTREIVLNPSTDFFQQALTAAGLTTGTKAYFVDDSAINIKGSNALGFGHSVLFDEFGGESERLGGLEKMEGVAKVSVINNMQRESYSTLTATTTDGEVQN
jgi:hypothetical protein